jgi:hypothetical protein
MMCRTERRSHCGVSELVEWTDFAPYDVRKIGLQ